MSSKNIFSFNLNYSDFIVLECSDTIDTYTSFLVDTQADISVIKIEALNENAYIDSSDLITIKGITTEPITSFGTVQLDIYFQQNKISHTFHVVPNEFNIPSNGIIGKEFNKKHNCKIDYSDMTYTIRCNGSEISIPINFESQENTVVLPARSETFRIFHILNFKEPSIILNQEIESGIFIPTTVVHSQNTVIRVLNTNFEPKSIKNVIKSSANLSDYNVFQVKKSVDDAKREKLFKKKLSEKSFRHAKREILELCTEFSDIFAMPDDQMSVNNFYEQKIRTKDNEPVYVKNYRLPHTQKQEINSQVQKLLSNDLIEPSVSSYNSPLILVPKKSTNGEKKWRMCVDYRMLNRKLVADKFPLPRIDDILDGLGRAKYFSILDLYSGFHQIPIEKDSREMTAFSTERGSFQWKVLPFGLNIAPNSFSRMMAIAFSGLSPERAFIYMDDIIVIGNSEKHHLNNLKSVFEVCRKFNLKLNLDKSDFFRPQVTFLGHTCTPEGILPDQSKFHAISNYPKPTNKEEAKRFVAFANYYRRFIPDFARLAQPINHLTRKKSEFIWTEECQQNFVELKNRLINPPILQYPDFEKEFRVTVDASLKACGAVLSQNVDGHDLPICFISKSFKKGELNKPIIEKELSAIHFAITTLRPYLYGTHFVVKSDHRPLVYLYNMKNPASKLTRIRLELEEYDFVVEHISGKENVVADALSIQDLMEIYHENIILVTTRAQLKRMNRSKNNDKSTQNNERPLLEPKVTEELSRKFVRKTPRVKSAFYKNLIVVGAHKNHRKLFEIEFMHTNVNEKFSLEKILSSLDNMATLNKINKLQWPMDDEFFEIYPINEFKIMCEKVLKNLKISLVSSVEVIKNEDQKKEILTKFHTDPIYGGHMGQKKLYEKIRSHYFWRNMSKDVAKFVNSCEKCKVNKPRNKVKAPMVLTKTPQKPFDLLIIDTVGPLPTSDNGNSYILTIICELSKYLITCAIPNKSANTVAKAIMNNVILKFGMFKEILSDQGSEFKNRTLAALFELLDIKQHFSTAYRHETVGSVERNHRFFNEYLRAYVTNMSQWEQYLPYFTFCYNISPHSSFSHEFSPFELIFSKKANLPNFVNESDIEPVYNYESFEQEARYRLHNAHKFAQKLLEKSKERNKLYYDRDVRDINVNIGDYVYLYNEPYDKHQSIYTGPYIVQKVIEPNIEVLDPKTNKCKTVHKNKIQFHS